jgi:hypothetical protein
METGVSTCSSSTGADTQKANTPIKSGLMMGLEHSPTAVKDWENRAAVRLLWGIWTVMVTWMSMWATAIIPRTPRDMSNDASRIDQVWLNDGSGQFSPGPQPNGLVDTTFAALSDLDNDGDLDAFRGITLRKFYFVE